MSSPNDTIRVVIPLAIRRRNGRPRILPPEDVAARQARAQDPHILKALGRAWAWRRKLDSGEVATAGDLAKLEGVTERFVSRTMRLAYLSPEVLERMLVEREPPATTWYELVKTASTAWSKQTERIFGR
jgi:alkylated DNA nucleotide flippase Atl1